MAVIFHFSWKALYISHSLFSTELAFVHELHFFALALDSTFPIKKENRYTFHLSQCKIISVTAKARFKRCARVVLTHPNLANSTVARL